MSYSSRSHRKIASNLLAIGGELIPRPLVEVDENGVIVSVERYDDIDRVHSAEFYAGIMTAGFVNAHSHLELSYLRGQISKHKGFAEFARQIGEVRTKATIEQRLKAIEREDLALRRGGVVAVGDIVNGKTSMDCKSRSSIRYRNFGELFGLRTTSFDDLLWCEDYPHSSITPHSIYSLNDEIFKLIARRNINQPLSIHFKESSSEEELFAKRGRLWDWYESVGFECDFLHYGSVAERVIGSVPPERSVLLVHNCCVTQSDIDTIMGHFTAPVYWVVCPRSNDYISQLTPPVELLRKNGLNICIGTDSLASNDSLSILEEMAMMPQVPLAERIDWATRQGAKALGFSGLCSSDSCSSDSCSNDSCSSDLCLNDKYLSDIVSNDSCLSNSCFSDLCSGDLGEIKVGTRPGINIISGVDYRSMQLTPQSKVDVIV